MVGVMSCMNTKGNPSWLSSTKSACVWHAVFLKKEKKKGGFLYVGVISG
uniref:Uncharacterized protein n=1 Tax=Rhizophora mucronata TaxID=61149 RepID=A0A2P2JD52_RHIMU